MHFGKSSKKRVLVVAASIVLVAALAFGITAGLLWDSIPAFLSFGGKEETPPLTLEEADPDFVQSRYTYTPTVYQAAATAPNAPGQKVLGFELVSGMDFLVKDTATLAEAKAEVDKAIKTATGMDMTAMTVQLQKNGRVIYPDTADSALSDGGDLLRYIIDKAKENKLYVIAKYNPFLTVQGGNATILDPLCPEDVEEIERIAGVVAAYPLDGILFSDCVYEEGQGSYTYYAQQELGSGFDAYKYNGMMDAVAKAIGVYKTTNSAVYAGLSVNAVWATADTNPEGLNVIADYETYYDGMADTRAWLNNNLFDFVLVENHSALSDKALPFERVYDWWADVASKAGIDVYASHGADKVASKSTGWSSYDELPRQIMALQSKKAYNGSFLYSVTRIAAYGEICSVLTKTFKGETSRDDILRNLTITSPSKTSTVTYESLLKLAGSSDPNFSVTLNGKTIERTSKGYFSLNFDLDVGTNKYTLSHKGKTVTYSVERKVVVLKSVEPTSAITVYSGDPVVFTCTALRDATVYANIDGKKVQLIKDEVRSEDSADQFSDYINFSGFYTVPATSKARTIPSISFTATWTYKGRTYTETMNGAKVTVKVPDASVTKVVEIKANQAEVFSFTAVDDKSRPIYYPLPKGTRDYVVGEVTSPGTDENGVKFVYVYYKLKSGKRIYKSGNGVDMGIASVTTGTVENNSISKVTLNKTGNLSNLSFAMSSKVPFTVQLNPVSYAKNEDIDPNYGIDSFGATTVDILFDYTVLTSKLPDFSGNSLFSKAEWVQKDNKQICRLTLAKAGNFFGVTSSYQGNDLVFQFKNPPVMKYAANEFGFDLTGVKIMLDPGHGGGRVGAVGANPNYPEKRINLDLAYKVRDVLTSLGAEVYMTRDGDTAITLSGRVRKCEETGSQIFISLHHNSTTNVNAIGTEAYYYMPFAKSLANAVHSEVVRYYGVGMYPEKPVSAYSRSVKYGPYGMIRTWSAPSILMEYAFMSNSAELEKAINPAVQNGFAKATARGIIEYIKQNGIVEGTYIPPTSPSSAASSAASSSEVSSTDVSSDDGITGPSSQPASTGSPTSP